jgi:hypothetical protein
VQRALCVPKTGREIQFRGRCFLTTAVKVNVVLLVIFDTNQSFHVRLAVRFFRYEIRNRRIYNMYFLTPKEYHRGHKKRLQLTWDATEFFENLG